MLVAILIFSILSFLCFLSIVALFALSFWADNKQEKKVKENLSVNTALSRATKEQLENALKNNEFTRP